MKEKVYFDESLFRERQDGPHLLGSRCKGCGKVFFPRTVFCNECLGGDFEEKELSNKGELYSYTITRVPVAKYPVPHAIGMISIPEDRVRIVAPLMYDESTEYHVGDELEMVVGTLWEDDEIVLGYKFRHKEGGET